MLGLKGLSILGLGGLFILGLRGLFILGSISKLDLFVLLPSLIFLIDFSSS